MPSKIKELKPVARKSDGKFEKGASGNPHGSIVNHPFRAAVARAIAQDNATRLRACAERLLDLAAAGEAWAVKELADRLDGKAHQSVSADLNGSLTVEIVRLANTAPR